MLKPSKMFIELDEDELFDRVDSLTGALLSGTRESGSERVDMRLEELNEMHSNVSVTICCFSLSFGCSTDV